MSLVAYGSSDESATEESEENAEFTANEESEGDVLKSASSKHLFTSLPEPKSTTATITVEEDVIIPRKKSCEEKPKRKPVKIELPSLAHFVDDEPVVKKAKSAKASGLFSVLPPPKGIPISTKSFIPNILTRKKAIVKAQKKAPVKKSKAGDCSESDDDIDDLPEPFDDATWQKVCGRKKKVAKPIIMQPQFDPVVIELAPEPIKPDNALDNQAFKELVGNSKRKINIKLIDINEEEILPDKEVWMTKSLTDPTCAPKHEIVDPVNNTCKRKHHITYLAQQAKANEQELQNQWSQSRFSRKQTQAKYGF